MKTQDFLVRGEAKACCLAAYLIANSKWFEMTPWPNDEWYFTVKRENLEQIRCFKSAMSI